VSKGNNIRINLDQLRSGLKAVRLRKVHMWNWLSDGDTNYGQIIAARWEMAEERRSKTEERYGLDVQSSKRYLGAWVVSLTVRPVWGDE
jgi:hypothetical protein